MSVNNHLTFHDLNPIVRLFTIFQRECFWRRKKFFISCFLHNTGSEKDVFKTDRQEDHKSLSLHVPCSLAQSVGTSKSIKRKISIYYLVLYAQLKLSSLDAIKLIFVLTMLTWACLLGSKRNKQPTWWDCVWMMPAHTMLSGLGSIPSSNCIPKPESLVFAPAKSSGIWALNTFCALCFSLKW